MKQIRRNKELLFHLETYFFLFIRFFCFWNSKQKFDTNEILKLSRFWIVVKKALQKLDLACFASCLLS